MPNETQLQKPHAGRDFFLGLRSVVDACVFIFRTRSTWIWALAPIGILFGLVLIFSYLLFGPASEWIEGGLKEFLPNLGDAHQVGTFSGVVVSVLAALALGLLLTAPLSSPAMERLVRLQELALGVTPAPDVSALRQFVVSFTSQFIAALCVLPLALALSVVSFFLFPPLLPFVGVLSGALLSWTLLDFPFTLHGTSLRERLQIVGANLPIILGFSLASGVMNCVPLSWFFTLPIGVVAATRVLARVRSLPAPEVRVSPFR